MKVRLFRAGIGILLICLGYLVTVLVYRCSLSGSCWFANALSGLEIVSLVGLAASGLAMIFMSRMEPRQAENVSSDKDDAPPDTMISVTGVFDAKKYRCYRKLRSPSWREYMRVSSLMDAEHSWEMELDGLRLEISLCIVGMHVTCCSVRHSIPLKSQRLWTRPEWEIIIVDQEGEKRDVKIHPEGVFVTNLVIYVEDSRIQSYSPTKNIQDA